LQETELDQIVDELPFGIQLHPETASREVGRSGRKSSVRRRLWETVSGVERPDNRLLVLGDIDNADAARAALQRWLSRKAHEHLVTWTKRLAQENRLSVAKLTVKSQRT
jgi:predicted metal-dependent hydrolase